ncbi:MAG: hypothetical protein AB1465_02455 [Patescibacteria group bacterium]
MKRKYPLYPYAFIGFLVAIAIICFIIGEFFVDKSSDSHSLLGFVWRFSATAGFFCLVLRWFDKILS